MMLCVSASAERAGKARFIHSRVKGSALEICKPTFLAVVAVCAMLASWAHPVYGLPTNWSTCSPVVFAAWLRDTFTGLHVASAQQKLLYYPIDKTLEFLIAWPLLAAVVKSLAFERPLLRGAS